MAKDTRWRLKKAEKIKTTNYTKGIVHPKMKILSLTNFVILNLYDLFSFVKHKRRYFEECWFGKQTVSVPTDFYYMDEKKYSSKLEKLNSLFTNILHNIFFCVQ